MKKLIASALMILALLTIAQPAAAYELPKPKIIAVYFYADWCPNCKILSPLLDQARKEGDLDTKAILFVKLNLTDSSTIHQSILLAQGLGIAPYMQQQGSSTGYVALLSADTKKELVRFDRTSKPTDIIAGANKALGEPAAPAAAKP